MCRLEMSYRLSEVMFRCAFSCKWALTEESPAVREPGSTSRWAVAMSLSEGQTQPSSHVDLLGALQPTQNSSTTCLTHFLHH